MTPAAPVSATPSALPPSSRVDTTGPDAVALYDVDPDVVAALVRGCPAVAGLSGGPAGAAATYLAGRRVDGVRITPDTVAVHVVCRLGSTVGLLAQQVRAALAGHVRGRTVDIVVEDLEDPPELVPAPGAPTDAPAALPPAVTAGGRSAGGGDARVVAPAAGTPGRVELVWPPDPSAASPGR